MNNPYESTFQGKILVVDDEKRIRDGCHKLLTQEGFEVSTAENGDAGLEMIKNGYFDIVLLDLMMPGITGLELLPKVKEMYPETVIIVITGYSTIEHAVEAMKKGAFDFIPKPFSPEQLRLVVTKAINFVISLHDIAYEKTRMRALLNHLTDGVMVTDTNKKIALANPTFLRMVGHQEESIIGRLSSEIIQNERLNKMIDEALSIPEKDFAELVEEFKDGTLAEDNQTVLGVRCIPFRGRLQSNLGTITVVHDITNLKKIEQHKSDLVSLVAHEIRSPLNSAMMQLKLVLKGRAGDVSDKQEKIITRVSDKLQSLADLSSNLLDLAKIEAGLLVQEKQKMDMAGLLKEQWAFYKPRAEEKSITLDLEPIPDLPPILANRMNMEELLSNLITNAINYTPEGGKIMLSASMINNYVCVVVKDTGIGIDTEDIERIFDRFYRVKNEKTRFLLGTGLGLSIVKSIVESHNGMIKVENGDGEGSTFRVFIPKVES